MRKIKIAIAKFLGWLLTRRGLRWLIRPALMSIARYQHWKMQKTPRQKFIPKQKAKIYKVLAITPGRHHAWVESSAGIIRKPLGSIPARLLRGEIPLVQKNFSYLNTIEGWKAGTIKL